MKDGEFVVEKLGLPHEHSPLARTLLELNARSRRPSPFFTPEYLHAYLEDNERYAPSETTPFVLVVRRGRGGSIVAALPLKKVTDRSQKVPFTRVEFLVASEVDLPPLLVAPEHELAVAEVVMRALSRMLLTASSVELIQQPAHSPLYRARFAARAPWADVRDSASMAISSIGMKYPDVSAYFHALSHKMRSNVSRLARRLFADGALEYLTGSDPAVLPDLFSLYLGVEERSWKRGTDASLRRHSARERMYRALFGKAGALRHHVDVLLMKGEPVAAQLSVEYGPTMFAMETCYDERTAELGPGNLMLFVAVSRAIRVRATEMSLHGHFDYYKHRWLGETLGPRDVRILRRGSVPHARAVVGAAVRFARGMRERAVGLPTGAPEVASTATDRAPPPPVEPATLEVAARLRAHPAVTVYAGDAFAQLMPFPTSAETEPTPQQKKQRRRGGGPRPA